MYTSSLNGHALVEEEDSDIELSKNLTESEDSDIEPTAPKKLISQQSSSKQHP